MPNFREKMKAEAILNSSRASSPLSGIAFGDEGFNKSAQLSFFVEPDIIQL